MGRAIAYINKVNEQFKCCVDNKNAKIASYTTCLETRKTEQRAKLVEWLNKAAAAHKTRFDAFYVSAFGETPADALIQGLKGLYHGCVDTKVGASSPSSTLTGPNGNHNSLNITLVDSSAASPSRLHAWPSVTSSTSALHQSVFANSTKFVEADYWKDLKKTLN